MGKGSKRKGVSSIDVTLSYDVANKNDLLGVMKKLKYKPRHTVLCKQRLGEAMGFTLHKQFVRRYLFEVHCISTDCEACQWMQNGVYVLKIPLDVTDISSNQKRKVNANSSKENAEIQLNLHTTKRRCSLRVLDFVEHGFSTDCKACEWLQKSFFWFLYDFEDKSTPH